MRLTISKSSLPDVLLRLRFAGGAVLGIRGDVTLASSAALSFVANLISSCLSCVGPKWTMFGTVLARLLRVCPKSFSPNRMRRHRQLVDVRLTAPFNPEAANAAVFLARFLRWRLRHSQMMTRKIKAHPSAMSRICHHSSLPRLTATVGELIPVTDGSGAAVPVPDGAAIASSERQTPRPGTTLELDWQFAATQAPLRRTCVALEHARQLLDPGPEQLEQLESHVWQEEEVLSKY